MPIPQLRDRQNAPIQLDTRAETLSSESIRCRRDLRKHAPNASCPFAGQCAWAHPLRRRVCARHLHEKESPHADQLAAILGHGANIARSKRGRLRSGQNLDRSGVQRQRPHDGRLSFGAQVHPDHLHAGHSPIRRSLRFHSWNCADGDFRQRLCVPRLRAGRNAGQGQESGGVQPFDIHVHQGSLFMQCVIVGRNWTCRTGLTAFRGSRSVRWLLGAAA